MRMLEHFVHTAWARALAEALLQFLWEGAAAALVLALVLLACRSPRRRYAASCFILLALPAFFAVTFWHAFSDGRAPVLHVNALPPTVRFSAVRGPMPPALPPDSWTARLPWVTPVWVFGVILLYGRSLASWVFAQQLRRKGVCVAGSEWQERFRGLQSRLRITRPVLLLESCMVEVPVVIGFLRPVVLAPLGFLSGFPAEQVEAFLIHELAHIRRRDYLVNLAQTAIEGLLFYHPAVWWISSVVRAEREHCCDDVVVAMTGDARGYAAALTSLEQKRGPGLETALAATGGSLMQRIQRLLGADRPRSAAGPVIGLLLLTAGLILAWTPQTPALPAPPAAPAPAAQPAPVAAPEPVQPPDAPPAPKESSRAQRRASLEQQLQSLNRQIAEVDRAIREIELQEFSEQARRLAKQRSAQVGAAQNEVEAVRRRIEELRLRMNLEHPPDSADAPLLSDNDVAAMTRQIEELRTALETTQRPPVPIDRLDRFVQIAQQGARPPVPVVPKPYERPLQEDVTYIITDAERAAWKKLQTDEERKQFIEQFWLRRDPTPGTPANEFKEEIDRRVAYANDHFGFPGTPGWQTDRGRMYIAFGPPDEYDEHPSGGPGPNGESIPAPYQEWRYRHLDGIGNNVVMQFVDTARNGEYRMSKDPAAPSPR